MATLHRLTTETLNLMRLVSEDQSEDRLSYRNELRRLSSPSLSMAFSEYEHFLEYYGYWSLDSRLDAFSLSTTGLSATRGDDGRVRSLDEDIRHHFAKEIDQGPTERPVAMSGHRFDQHYIRFEGVGRGGVGSVWRGEHLKTGRPVAIKTLEGLDEVMVVGRKSTLKKKIERAMRALAQLSHPFITPVLDLSVHHAPPYYIMPLCTGGSLRDLIAQGPISPELGLNIFAQVCLGLAHAHDSGVLHLDLKPENILLDQSGNAQIFDFGLSRAVAKQVAQAGRQSYVGFGSVAYMPPELLRDPLTESPTIDIYALGLILYEILVGELPGRRSPMPSDVIKDLPLPIDDLFDAMVQDLPHKRPQSMAQVLEVLNKVEPFNRLSQKSMVLIFNQTPASVQLPGLTYLELPNPNPELDAPKADEAPTEAAAEPSQVAQPAPKSIPRLEATRRFEERSKSLVSRDSSSRGSALSATSRDSLSAGPSAHDSSLSSLAGGASSAGDSVEGSVEDSVEGSVGGSSAGALHMEQETPILSSAELKMVKDSQARPQAALQSSLRSKSADELSARLIEGESSPEPSPHIAPNLSPAPLTAQDRLGDMFVRKESAELIDEVEELVELEDFDDDFGLEENTALHPVSAIEQPLSSLANTAAQDVTKEREKPAGSLSPLQERLAKKYGPRT